MQLTTNDIPLNDPYVYKSIGTGKTKGLFQIESAGMQGLMKKMYADANKKIAAIERKYECEGFENPYAMVKTNYKGRETDEIIIQNIKNRFMEEMRKLGNEYFERLVAAISLYRPGPMDYIPDYLKGMENPDAIVYDTEALRDILSGTYGVIVYQEQVQQIVRKLAGYSLGRGDLIRRAMGKKKQSIMDAEKEVFIHGNEGHLKEGEAIVPGCIKNGVTEEAANIIWDKMAKFALYAFNKSHSAGYAVICIQTAWMKYYYPVDMFMSTLNSVITVADKIKGYIAEARDLGIQILNPSLNSSNEYYKIEDNKIRTGLMSIRNLGKMSHPIIEERDAHGDFKDIYDFIDRMNGMIDKKVLEALTYSGTLDLFGYTRSSLITSVPDIVEYMKHEKAGRFPEQPFNLPVIDKLYSEMGKMEIKECEEYDRDYLLEKEYESTGMYISGHPLDIYSDVLQTKGVLNTGMIVPEEDEETGERATSDYDEQSVQIAGVVRNLKPIITKKGDKMYMFDVEDKEGTIKIVAFPSTAKIIDSKMDIKNTMLVLAAGTVKDNDRGCQIVLDDISLVKDLDVSTTKTIYIDCVGEETVPESIKTLIDENPGTTEVLIRLKKGWVKSATNIDLNWSNYLKIRSQYPTKIN